MRALIVGCLLIAATGSVLAQNAMPPPKKDAAPVAAEAQGSAAALRKLAMVLMFTRVIGVTGIEKSPAAASKQLSLDIATASADMLAELKAAAAKSGHASVVPNALDGAYAEQAELLQSSFETQFEHEYLGMQITAHREAIGVLAAAMAGWGAASSLDGFARRVSSRLQAGLTGLEAAKRALPAM